MAETWQCTSMYVDDQYIAGNNLEIQPGEDVQFVTYVSNTNENVQCDALVEMKLLNEDLPGGSKRIHYELKEISGNDNLFGPKFTHQDLLDEVGPGRYAFETVVMISGSREEADSQVWSDGGGDPHIIEVFDADGNPPGAKSNITVTDVQQEKFDAVVGEEVDVDVDATNNGELSGSKTFDVECNGSVVGSVSFSLGAGESSTKTLRVTMPDASGCDLSVGGSQADINIYQDPVQNRDLSVDVGVNQINGEFSWTNVSDTDIQFRLDVAVIHAETKANVWTQMIDTVANASTSGTKEFSLETSVPAGETEQFEVCTAVVY